MRFADIIELTGTKQRTLYNWMEKHPTVATPDSESLLGHPFPRPTGNAGRALLWDADAVRAWWAANKSTVGRHPKDSASAIICWDRYRAAMMEPPTPGEGDEPDQDHMAGIVTTEREGDNVKLTFRSVNDAIMFKLTYG